MADYKLISDTHELNPLLEPEKKAFLSVISENSEKADISRFELTAKTLLSSGGANVLSVSPDGTVTPENGGLAEITAVNKETGEALAPVKITVRPFWREYHKTFVYKLFLAIEEYGSLRKPKSEERDASVYLDFEETLDLIRKIDNISCGMPKIVYLVGWQWGGHDHLYPAFNEVNPKLKRKQDKTALESLRWLIREAKKYNTSVSLHINFVDAWEDSPLWNEYLENHIFKEDENGNLLCAAGGFEPIQEKYKIKVSNVVQKRFYESGFFKKRIDELLEMVPEIVDSHSLHIDNWRCDGCPGMGISRADDEEASRKMFLYMREKGLDVTSEGSFHGRSEPMTGLQPMTWWDTPYPRTVCPPSLYCGGRICRTDSDGRFGDSAHIENTVRQNLARNVDICERLQDEFMLYTLPWYFLNCFELESFDGNTAVYSGGVRAYIEDGQTVIYQNETRIRFGTALFVPMLWESERQILVYSARDTYFYVKMPDSWKDVTSVDLYYSDRLGRYEKVLEIEALPISEDGCFRCGVDSGTAYVMKPHINN